MHELRMSHTFRYVQVKEVFQNLRYR